MKSRPRDTNAWVICEDTGDQAVNGACPHHGGDACLIVVHWVGWKGITVNEIGQGAPADLTPYIGGPPVEAKR